MLSNKAAWQVTNIVQFLHKILKCDQRQSDSQCFGFGSSADVHLHHFAKYLICLEVNFKYLRSPCQEGFFSECYFRESRRSKSSPHSKECHFNPRLTKDCVRCYFTISKTYTPTSNRHIFTNMKTYQQKHTHTQALWLFFQTFTVSPPGSSDQTLGCATSPSLHAPLPHYYPCVKLSGKKMYTIIPSYFKLILPFG